MQEATSSNYSSIWHWKCNKNLSIPVLGYVNLPIHMYKTGTQMLCLQLQEEPKLVWRVDIFKGSLQWIHPSHIHGMSNLSSVKDFTKFLCVKMHFKDQFHWIVIPWSYEEKTQIDLDMLSKFALRTCNISRVNCFSLKKTVWFPILMSSWISLKRLGASWPGRTVSYNIATTKFKCLVGFCRLFTTTLKSLMGGAVELP